MSINISVGDELSLYRDKLDRITKYFKRERIIHTLSRSETMRYLIDSCHAELFYKKEKEIILKNNKEELE